MFVSHHSVNSFCNQFPSYFSTGFHEFPCYSFLFHNLYIMFTDCPYLSLQFIFSLVVSESILFLVTYTLYCIGELMYYNRVVKL